MTVHIRASTGLARREKRQADFLELSFGIGYSLTC